MRQTNIVLFSSGITEKNGILNSIGEQLNNKGYNCVYWRDLFGDAHDQDNIALLPMLIKKIPTFDFAVLICQGHDKTFMLQGSEIKEVNTMRDNVLFEIGLCTMALGLSRTILLTDEHVRLPDDLTGINGNLAIKRIIYDAEQEETYKQANDELSHYIDSINQAVEGIDKYIQSHKESLSPVVIGAAASTACGYVSNFVFRTLEKIDYGVELEDGMHQIDLKDIYMHIILPETYVSNTPDKAYEVIKKYKKGCVPSARMRKAEFKYEIVNHQLHIYDYPTSLVTSYNTAKRILQLDANDDYDLNAKDRFIAKEMDLFEATLISLLHKQFIIETVEHYYKNHSKEQREHIIEQVNEMIENRVTVERIDY